jgi:hypothetical protein
MLVIPRVRGYLRYFRFRYLVRENAANSLTFRMDLQHYARRGRAVQREELFKDIDDKLHRSVIVIQQHHLVQGGLFDLWPGFFDDDAGIGTGGMLIWHNVLYRGRQTATQACDDGRPLTL